MLNVVLDLSHWNQVTSWQAIKDSGIVGVILKASQGLSYVDPTYLRRRQEVLDVGLLSGAYHFGERGDPFAQAAHFLATASPQAHDLLVLDFEPCADTMTLAEAETFVQEVALATGRTPGLYSGQSFCTDCLHDVTASPLEDCWLWLARYSTTPPVAPPLWETWSMWQHTQAGTVPGVEGPVDRDRFNGTMEGLLRLWGVSPSSV